MAANKTTAVKYSQAAPARVVLLLGKAEPLAQRAAQQVRDQLRQQHDALEVHDLAADQLAAGELLTLASPSLFGEPRLLRITGCERASADFVADFTRVVPLLDEFTCLQLRHSDPVRGKEMLKLAREVSGVLEVDCAEPKNQNEKFEVMRLEAARIGAQLDSAAAQQLLQAYNADLGELLATIAQLASDAGGRITAQTVAELTAGRVETTAFAVVDAALAGNAAQALTLLRQALLAGAEPIPVLGALGKAVRDMARVHGRRQSAAQLAKELGMPPWLAEKAVRNAGRWREVDLARTVQLLATTDLALKGDARDPQYALEKLVLTVARRGRA
ncbi:DNA polymerase III subunit delta [Leucobacter sp. OH2974_COT-288]|uniref:DNA-directed DNA polymerase n=1 Tax=Canibacter oris TaxID=1365628 RepID=A0A840DHU2_9MICO|nr:DNA polymerase III subunit delta [Canibacter oris]MBB4071345.1 DNA polymerase-3 subunit delta [Canibacter oris]RRD35291.1 DNA polymerase III subunit delta [Leucobacter sp. OH2974_COT-288]